MTKLKKFISIIFLLNIIIPLVGVYYSDASEHNSLLKGEYISSRILTCASGFFNTDLSRSTNGQTWTVHTQDTYTFNGDGTGSITFTFVLIRDNRDLVGQYPIGHGFGSGIIFYNVDEDKKFTIESQITVIDIVGAPKPPSIIIDIEMEGLIGLGNQLLLIYDTKPNIETYINEDGDIVGERICGRTITAIRKKMID